MNIVVSTLCLILWMLIIPMCIGLAFNFILPRARRTVGITFVLGYLVYMAVFEIVAIACMTRIVYSAFTYCRRIFAAIAIVLALAGIVRSLLRFMKSREDKSILIIFPGEAHADIQDLLSPRADLKMLKTVWSRESRICWGIFFVLMAFQMVMSIVMASFDGDDAYYVVESLLAQQADVMNTILPYTGTSTSLDIRHALAVITMWIGFLAKVSGIHATILSHLVMPLFVIPFVYLIYVEIARVLFRERQNAIPVFVIIVGLLMMFGNVSIYTPATFFLMRTWQGKAMVANLVFPMIFWIFFWMMEDTRQGGGTVIADKRELKLFTSGNNSSASSEVLVRYKKIAAKRIRIAPWIMLFFINMLSGVCSSMGVIFGSGLVALLTLVLLFYSKRITVLLGAIACVVPNLVYLGIYFSLFIR